MTEEQYAKELRRHHIQKHLIDEIKNIKIDEIKNISCEQKRNVELAKAFLHVSELTKTEPKMNVLGKRNTALCRFVG